MMPLLLHGPAIKTSRTKLQDLRKKFDPDNIVVFGSEASPGQVVADLMTVPLFSEDRLIVWENPSEDFVLNSELITPNSSLILWFDHKIDPKKWSGFEVLFFSEAKEVSVFPLLDYLAAKDQKAFLEIEKLKQNGFDIHYFLTMTFYLLRNLVVTPKTAPDFVKRKLARQRVEFDRAMIIKLYKDLLEIDFKIKSGLLEKPQAEFLLVNKFSRN